MKSFQELELELCVVELRFDPEYRLWDHVGSIWSSMIALNPSLKGGAIQPTQQSFETESLQLTLETSVLRASGRGPRAVEDVTRNAAWMVGIVWDRVKLGSFTRAGFRQIKRRAFPTSLQALNFASFPGEDASAGLGADSRRVGFMSSARFETEKAGLHVAVKVEEREVTFAVPWESRPFVPHSSTKKEWVLVADSDYYTIGLVERESLDIETWVLQASKAIQSHWRGL